MTDFEVISHCLDHYIKALNYCKENNLDDSKAYLYTNCLSEGVCYFIEATLHPMRGTAPEWIIRNCEGVNSRVWTRFPSYAKEHTEIIERLEIRVNILKKELKRVKTFNHNE